MRLTTVILCVIGAVLTGCGKVDDDSSAPLVPTDSLASVERKTTTLDRTQTDLGAIEAMVKVQITVDDQALGDKVTQEVMENAKYEVSLATVAIEAPYPTTLPATVWLEVGHTFKDRTGLLIGRLYRDDEPFGESWTAVLDINSQRTNYEWRYDLMVGLDETPASALFYAKATAVLVEPDWDGAPLDAQFDPEAWGLETTTVLSNPLRVNFVPAQGGESAATLMVTEP